MRATTHWGKVTHDWIDYGGGSRLRYSLCHQRDFVEQLRPTKRRLCKLCARKLEQSADDGGGHGATRGRKGSLP